MDAKTKIPADVPEKLYEAGQRLDYAIDFGTEEERDKAEKEFIEELVKANVRLDFPSTHSSYKWYSGIPYMVGGIYRSNDFDVRSYVALRGDRTFTQCFWRNPGEGGIPAIQSERFRGEKGLLFFAKKLSDEDKEWVDRRKRFYDSVHAAKCCRYCKHCGSEYHPENDDGEEDQPMCELSGFPVCDTDICDKYEEPTREDSDEE